MSVTELDDLKSVWQTLNRNLERQHTLALHQFKETKMARFRSGLRPLVLGQLLQLVIGVAITLASAQFWVNHIGAPLLLICGLFLHGYGIMFIAFGARDLLLIRRIDYSAPVVGVQKQLAGVRRLYVLGGMLVGLPWWLLWLPVTLMFFKAAFDCPWLIATERGA